MRKLIGGRFGNKTNFPVVLVDVKLETEEGALDMLAINEKFEQLVIILSRWSHAIQMPHIKKLFNRFFRQVMLVFTAIFSLFAMLGHDYYEGKLFQVYSNSYAEILMPYIKSPASNGWEVSTYVELGSVAEIWGSWD